MYELLSKKIANYLLHIGVITLDKKEVCAFGLENIISRIFVWIFCTRFLLDFCAEVTANEKVFHLSNGFYSRLYGIECL